MGHDIANPDAVSRSALFPKFEADALVAMIENQVGTDDVTDLLLVNLKPRILWVTNTAPILQRCERL